MTTDDQSTVLVVDDAVDVVEMYALDLEDEYEVRKAYGGEDALAKVDETVDVALLDRRMPDVSGDEVLEAIRNRGLGVRVAMVTAVDPDFDIATMDFDAYVTKPVDADEVRDVVSRLLRLSTYDDRIRTQFALVEKKLALEAQKPASELSRNEEYATLSARVESLQAETAELVEDIGHDGFKSAITGPPEADR